MKEYGVSSPNTIVKDLKLGLINSIFWNLSPAELIEKSIRLSQGFLSDTGALVVSTGEFTGRSPKDKYIVCDDITNDTIWWGDVNQKFDSKKFDILLKDMTRSLTGEDIFVQECYACADPRYKINIRVVTETPWASLFSSNMFLRVPKDELSNFKSEWTVICVPSYKSTTNITRKGNFTIINFTKKILLIGGSSYTGEIKKGIFTILNFLLPQQGVLPMHCSANVGKFGDTALYFGLSGTGKTSLSADPERRLIGDDEHGWSDNTVFNFEGGCYAKCVNLSQEKEPDIFNAIKFGSILENTLFKDDTKTVDYTNTNITENTRVSYPINFIKNILVPSLGGIPRNIFFLTCDATGVLPPISLLTPEQAMYHFISGYTAKVAGTEMGVTEPQLTFSACFGKAFLPLHPNQYAEMLGSKLKQYAVNVWLVNTGWVGGGYGVGERINIQYTRTLVKNALEGNFKSYNILPMFDLSFPTSCKGIASEILNPRESWKNKEDYDMALKKLYDSFENNYKQFKQ